MRYVLLLLLIGCDGADRRDAQHIANLVGRLRNDANAATVDLENAHCDGDVCTTRDACLASLKPTFEANKLRREVEVGVTAIEQGRLDKTSEQAKALPKKVDDAQRLLDEGHDKMPVCDERLADMKRKYRF